MKTIFLTLLICIALFSCGINNVSSQSQFTETSLSQSDKDTILSSQDSLRLHDFFNAQSFEGKNAFVHPEHGVTILFSKGVTPEYQTLFSFPEDNEKWVDEGMPSWISADIQRNLFLKLYGGLSISNDALFHCDSIIKTGDFYDRSQNISIMTESLERILYVAEAEREVYGEEYIKQIKEDIVAYKEWENRSIRVVITRYDANNDPVIAIYHFTRIDGILYLKLLDFESFNCSV